MAKFFARVELHKKAQKNVTEEDYRILHEEIAKKSFYPRVEYDNDSNIYHLLTGSYRKVAPQSIKDAHRDIVEACNETIKKSSEIESFSFFLTEYTNSSKHNLKTVAIRRN